MRKFLPVNKFSYISSFFNLPLNDQNTYKVAKPGLKAPTVGSGQLHIREHKQLRS